MTVTSTFAVQVKPGRFEDALALCRSAAKPLERLGAHNVRVLRGSVSAENFGSLVVTMEYESGEAWGAAYDRITTDDELVTLMAQSDSERSPYLAQSITSAIEIPVGAPTGSGPVISTILSRANPGRFQDAVALGSKVADLQCRLGANGTRLFWLGPAGAMSGALVLSSEYANMAALGRGNDAFLAAPEGQDLLEGAYGVNAAVTILSEDIYTEIVI